MKLNIIVIPNSSRNSISELEGGFLKVTVTTIPENGKANSTLIKLLAKHYSVPKQNISILRGQTGRRKVVEIIK